jgi:sialate O-acetylesterase
MKHLILMIVAVCLMLTGSVRAERPFLPRFFADGMVLQRDAAVPIWGFAAPGTVVKVTFADQVVEATSDSSGRWLAKLAPMPASFESRSLSVASTTETRTVGDVLVGDVYLLAGQSNMSWPLRAAKDDKVLAEANHPWLRVFIQATTDGAKSDRADDVAWGKWKACTPESAGAMSGLGYHFATELKRHVDVPIALIHTAVGGTRIESWIDLPTLKTIPTIDSYFQAVERSEQRYAEDEAAYKPKLAEWEKNKVGNKPAMSNMLGYGRFRRPSALFNGLVSPLQPMALRGVIWYQGEGNASNNPTHYTSALRTLIDSWRRDFGQLELPFMIVQLPSYHDGKQWPGTREAQRAVAQSMPNVGLIVSIDIGDPTNLHPASKVDVGLRAARLARAMIYRHDVVATGPIARVARRSGNDLIIDFDHAGTGLRIAPPADGQAPATLLSGFEVREAEDQFRAVEASITSTNQITLRGAGGVGAVRYAWTAVPDNANLRNSENIPAAGFLLQVSE